MSGIGYDALIIKVAGCDLQGVGCANRIFKILVGRSQRFHIETDRRKKDILIFIGIILDVIKMRRDDK